jgi:lycopene cyclase domain-containing protein
VNAEYLLLNALIIGGPLVMSFEKNIFFVSRWRFAWPAIALVAAPYLIWDALVTGRHWWFNEKYTVGLRLAGLPVEEWMFFLTVPFAALFVWEVIAYHFSDQPNAAMPFVRFIFFFAPAVGAILFATGREYTGLMLIFLGAAAMLEALFKTGVMARSRGLIYFGAVTIFIIIFNGYLTARPVVLYGEAYQLGLRLGTIPIEDFGYGYSLILAVTVVYEKLKALADD